MLRPMGVRRMGSFGTQRMPDNPKPSTLTILGLPKDPKNVRLSLSTNEMNPFGEMTNPHNTWPVILSLYSIPS
jgi:hypothetical protein